MPELNLGILADAGRNDPAHLAASLVPPGASVRLEKGAPAQVEDQLLRRHCDIVSTGADVVMGAPASLGRAQWVVATAPHLGHGGTPDPGAVSAPAVVAAATAAGRKLRAQVRHFMPFEDAPGVPSRRSDPLAWVRWLAVAAGGPPRATPRPRPRQSPGPTVLVLAHEPFNAWDEGRRQAILELHRALTAAGHELVLSWEPRRLTGSVSNHLDLRRAGITLHGGDGVFDPMDDHEALIAPSLRQLIGAYRPVVVVVADADRAGDDLTFAATMSPETRFLGLGLRGELLDSWTTNGRLAADITSLLATRRHDSPPRIGVVQRRERQAGLTSVVIPVHGRWDLTHACLESLKKHTKRPLEIVVVDNASPDDTRWQLSMREDVTVVPSDVNLGFAGGTNAGLAVATGEFVCLLNNDTEVTDGWLDELHIALSHASTGAVGPRSNCVSGVQLVPDAPRLDDPAVHEWAAQWVSRRRGRHWVTSRLVGFCMLLPAQLLEELGALDEGVGVGNFEDDELCQRVQSIGKELRVADGALVLHHGSATFGSSDVGYLAALRSGARHVGGLTVGHGAISARIVCGPDPAACESTTAHARTLADDLVLVPSEDDYLGALLAAGHVDIRSIRLAGPNERVDSNTKWIIHLRAGDLVDPSDWGRDRAAIESLPRVAHTVARMPGVILEPCRGTIGPPGPETAGSGVTEAIRPRPTRA